MTTFERVQRVIADDLGVDESEIKLDTPFVDICTDSLEMASLVQDLEEEFSICIEDMTNFLTVQDAVRFAEAH